MRGLAKATPESSGYPDMKLPVRNVAYGDERGTMTLVSKTFELYGKTYVFECGELARQATGAALVKQGDSTVLNTVVVSKERKN